MTETEVVTSSQAKAQVKLSLRLLMREYLESLLVAVLVALFLRFFVIAAYKIPTGSMAPTLKTGDLIFSYRLAYGVPLPFAKGEKFAARLPRRGDVVVFKYPSNPSVNYVKRVVGLPGDKLVLRGKQVWINDQPASYQEQGLNEISDLPGHDLYAVHREKLDQSNHLIMNALNPDSSKVASEFGPIVVPPEQIFVLGDNRDSSDDSRYWGCVPLKNLEGRVITIWLSLNWLERWGGERFPSIRWERFFRAVE